MITSSLVRPRMNAIAAELPASQWSTEELLTASQGHFSKKLTQMLASLGVEKRHSILSNYTDVLFKGAAPQLEIPASKLAVKAARAALAKAQVDPESIGLVLGVTSSPGRLLPSLVCDMVAEMGELPRTVGTLSIEYMGCSAMAKVIDTVRWYLTCEPRRRVLVCFMDAITPMSPELPGSYGHFTEVPAEQRQETVNAMHGFLFGDAAVGMVFGVDGPGPSFGPVSHLTNDLPEDTELGTVPDGGSDIPLVYGRRLYTLSPDVTPRGTHYAVTTVNALLESEHCGLERASDASVLLMHTGSAKILDGLCEKFEVAKGSDVVASSYRVLHDYGNTIGCSVPLMLAEPTTRRAGEGILVTFGLSFSCGAFSMTIPAEGWTP